MTENQENFENLVKEYKLIEKKFNLPEFEKLQEDFDLNKITEREGGILIRDVRRAIGEKIAGYLHFFETLSNPTAPPLFVYTFLKNLSDNNKKEIKDIYKELSRMQIKLIKLDTIFNEKDEIDFIKETYSGWQKMKKRIYSLVDNFEKEFEKSSNETEKSYFG
jgi:hypothetical protein